MTYYVYALVDPRNGERRYVGKSSKPEARLWSHVAPSASAPVRAWVAELAPALPSLVILERVESEAEALIAERKWIAALSECDLLNAMYDNEPRKRKPRRYKFTGFGERLGQRMNELGIKQAQLARLTGIGHPELSRMRNGHRPFVGADSAVIIARALDCSVEWLVTGQDRASAERAA